MLRVQAEADREDAALANAGLVPFMSQCSQLSEQQREQGNELDRLRGQEQDRARQQV